jgi:uncharacterized protein YceK
VASVVRRLIVLIPLLGLCGCGTLLSPKSSVYSGVQMDASLAYHSLPHPAALLPVIDMPFSFLADTVLLPATLSSSPEEKAEALEKSEKAKETIPEPRSLRAE